jgi:hypothetical protein
VRRPRICGAGSPIGASSERARSPLNNWHNLCIMVAHTLETVATISIGRRLSDTLARQSQNREREYRRVQTCDRTSTDFRRAYNGLSHQNRWRDSCRRWSSMSRKRTKSDLPNCQALRVGQLRAGGFVRWPDFVHMPRVRAALSMPNRLISYG